MNRIFVMLAATTLAVSSSSSLAATTLYTISGTGSGSLAGTGFTNAAYVLSFTADDRSNMPTATYFQVSAGPRVTLNIMTAFGTAFDTFYLQNLSSRFRNDFFDFTLPDPNVDIYAPFTAVTGTNVTALGGFNSIDTTGGLLTLASSSNVRFQGALPLAAAVPEPSTWAMMILGMGAIGFAMRRQRVAMRVTYAA